MIIVAGPVEIGRHHRDEIGAVLLAVGLAQLDGGDLGDGVPLVGRLERAGEQRLFAHRLRRELGIDAGGAERQQLLDAGAKRSADDVEADGEIVGDEVGGIGVVGIDAADMAGGEEHDIGLVRGEPAFGLGLVGQVEPLRSAVSTSQPSPARRRTMADPAMPLWPAT